MMEILLVLALIGLLASILIGGAAQLLNDKPATAEEVFWASVQEARKMALKNEREVTLKFLDEKERGKSFVLSDGVDTKTMPVPAPGDLEVAFLSTQKGTNLMMIGGTAVETQPIPSVSFFPDGTCTSFRVQFLRGGNVRLLAIDPWTCAPMLSAADAASASGTNR